MKKGLFISFEGIDKSGKSTQISLLADYLKRRGYEVLTTCEPGGTELGKIIKEVLLSPSLDGMSRISELFLYLADRREHVEKVIKPALRGGKVVISDRFVDASVAYQGYGRGISISWIEDLNKIVTGGILPDITFLLDISPSLAKERSEKKDRMEREDTKFYEKVRQGYLEIAKSFPDRIRIIKATRGVWEIFSEVKKEISKYLDKGQKECRSKT
ncbi:dTMP kinase [Candidatus Aerophobetes bacterium]|uniref:Thymidylate kinase n=1 Tax=Aerophobetes bacterium TaxID=2030807 RepID=A0A497E673_UNCAE|nr:MAG: dTMP kinase [Candidatus Aerophobetes bacterium]